MKNKVFDDQKSALLSRRRVRTNATNSGRHAYGADAELTALERLQFELFGNKNVSKMIYL